MSWGIAEKTDIKKEGAVVKSKCLSLLQYIFAFHVQEK